MVTSSAPSFNLHNCACLPPSQVAPSELDQGPVEKQVPGVQQEGEAGTGAKETYDAQIKKKDAEIQLLKNRFAIPTYIKVCIPSVCCCLLTGAFFLSLLPLWHCIAAGILNFTWRGSAFLQMHRRSLFAHTHCSSLHQQPALTKATHMDALLAVTILLTHCVLSL